MPPRHPGDLPRLWLVTDERRHDALWSSLAGLPRGSGVIFRHYALPPAARRALFGRVRALAGRRRLTLLLAGPPGLARAWRGDGFHGHAPGFAFPELIHTMPAHGVRALIAAGRAGADLVLLSPVHATRSHPGRKPLGRLRFGAMARQSPVPVVALGGMTARRARSLGRMAIYGWAGIDGLAPAGPVRI